MRTRRGALVDMPFTVSPDREEQLDQALRDAEAKMTKELDKQGSYWWAPGKSVSVNEALTGRLNVWKFSCLGHLPMLRAFKRSEGTFVTITPVWGSFNSPIKDSIASYYWPTITDKVIAMVNGSQSIEDNVNGILDQIEAKLNEKMDVAARQDIVRYCVKMAKTRLTSRSTSGKDFLVIPLPAVVASEREDRVASKVAKEVVAMHEIMKILAVIKKLGMKVLGYMENEQGVLVKLSDEGEAKRAEEALEEIGYDAGRQSVNPRNLFVVYAN